MALRMRDLASSSVFAALFDALAAYVKGSVVKSITRRMDNACNKMPVFH